MISDSVRPKLMNYKERVFRRRESLGVDNNVSQFYELSRGLDSVSLIHLIRLSVNVRIDDKAALARGVPDAAQLYILTRGIRGDSLESPIAWSILLMFALA